MMKAIETSYRGYRFRSRVEARWAVFFDSLGVKWQYEPEGFNIDGVYYLPDFYLPDLSYFVEVKPELELSAKDAAKINAFKSAVDDSNVFVLKGHPVSFRDDDRATRFDSHIEQMIFCSCVSTKLGKLNIDDYRKASKAARSARFEHGEKPR
jgi:hypothetical protein